MDSPQPETLDPQTLDPQTLTENPNPQSTAAGEDDSSGRRRRRSRWDPPEDQPKKRKSRWANEEPTPVTFQLPDFMQNFTNGAIDSDPEIQALNARLMEISRILQSERSGVPLDDRPEGARSPSPEPVYDNLGVRINTREYRARERLNRERQEIIAQIIKRNPAFKPPADYRPPKLQKKLYIPMKEYPGYNFIGLIIGPRGNTQKRMEKETGAKIVIRGKGSIKEGRLGLGQKRDLKFDPAENEDLHVLVEADTADALEAAAGMVEKLLQPVDEGLNEHKRQQLRELASLNGTIREDEFCRLCGEAGHRQYACPSRFSTFKSDVLCKICGDGGHPTIDCPVKGTSGKKMDDEYQSFLAELGGTGPESATKPLGSALALMGPNGSSGISAHPGLGSVSSVTPKGEKEIDETNLYIGYLPPTMEDDALIRLFQPFGEISKAKVIKDRDTGVSKGYGFVKYNTINEAKQAVEGMNGYRLDGRVIAVRVAGMPPQPVAPPRPPMNPYPPMGGQSMAGIAPPGGYMSNPVPWGQPQPPPPPPPPYAQFSAPLSVATMYPPPPYYPPPPPLPQSEAQEGRAPGVPAQQGNGALDASSISVSNNNNNNNNMYMQPGSQQPMYQSPYPSYYAMPMPPPQYQQSFANAPWTYNPPAPPPPPVSSAADKSQQLSSGDTEYEKFMAEMK